MNKYNILNSFNTKNIANNNQESNYLDIISKITLNSLNLKVLSPFFKDDSANNYSNKIFIEKTYASK